MYPSNNRHKGSALLTWLIILTVLIVALIVLLPFGIRYAAERWFYDHGAEQAVIKEVHFNLFTGELELKELAVTLQGQSVLQIKHAVMEIDWSPFWHKQISLTHLSLNQLNIAVNQYEDGRLLLGSVLLPKNKITSPFIWSDSDHASRPWGLAVKDFTLNDAQIRFHSQKLESHIVVSRITLNNLKSWKPEQPAHLKVTMAIDNEPLKMDGDLLLFKEEPQINALINIKGFDLKMLSGFLQPRLETSLTGKLDTNVDLNAVYQKDAGWLVKANGKVLLSSMKLVQTGFTANGQQITWTGQAQLFLPPSANHPLLKMKGELNASGLLHSFPEQHLQVNQDNLWWNGQLDYKPAFDTGKPTILMQADAIVNNLKIFELEKSLSLLEAEQVEAHNINVDAGNNVLVANMQISNLHMLSPLLEENLKTAHSLLYAGKTIVEDIALEQTNNLSIAALRFHDLAALITRNRDKTWHLINDINFAGAKELQEQLNAPQSTVITRPVQSHSGNVAENEKVKNTAPALKVKIGVAEILENSQLIFVDKSVTPVYFTKLNSLLARVENLDTDKPKQASSININAKVGKDATVVLSGRINPFAKKLSADLTGKIENFKLPPLSSYTGKNLGYTFKHGFMSADIKLKIKNGKYKMKDNVVLTNLTLVAKDSHIIERIAKQLNMPLDTALDLLRDKNNSIELSIPVRGDLKSLNSDMADVINQAVTKALNSASISYVTRVLKPFGSFTPMVTQADEVTSPQFEPVIFEAGKSELNLAEQKYLKKLAGFLVERPRIRLALCGRATETDRKIINEREKKISQAEQPLTPFNRKTARGKGGTSPPPTKSTSEKSAERLRELAKARARAVKEYFTRRHGIDAKRLLLCHPKANIVDKKARPRVDIEL